MGVGKCTPTHGLCEDDWRTHIAAGTAESVTFVILAAGRAHLVRVRRDVAESLPSAGHVVGDIVGSVRVRGAIARS
jgi:hypothetical protein